MTELTIAPYDFTKVGYSNIDPDPEQWSHNVSCYLHERLPYLAKYKTRIIFETIKEQEGYAYGSVRVGTDLYIPITIKNFELLPLDLFVYKGKFHPLTEKKVEELLFDSNMFSASIDPQKIDSSVYPASHPPHSGKYIYASISLLNELDKHITAEDKARVLNSLNDPKALTGFKKHGHYKLLKTIMDLDTVR